MKTRSSFIYTNPGKPFHGVPSLDADRTFNSRVQSASLGNGNWPFPMTSTAGTTVYGGAWRRNDTGTGVASILGTLSGGIIVTTGGTDEDQFQVQNLGFCYQHTTTRAMACFARVTFSSVATTDFFFGFGASDTTLIAASANTCSDGIHMFKADTATDFTATVKKATTATTATTGLTIANAGPVVCGFTVAGGVIKWYAVQDANDLVRSNPALLGSGTTIANTNAPNTVNCYPSLGCGAEGAGTPTVTVDWAVWWATHT